MAGWYAFVMRLVLIDDSADVVSALRVAFAPHREVEVNDGDLLARAENAIVSPANSQGFMDGGFDRELVRFFGPAIERRVRDAIALRPEGQLPIGASIVVRTDHPRVPWLIVAPTMISPEFVEPQNAYRAMRAVLRLMAQVPELTRGIFCPGLCTGVGGVEPTLAAREMATAYSDWLASPR